MNRYSKILHHINPTAKTETSKSSSGKKRTFEEYEEEQKKTDVDRLKEQTQQLTDNIEFLQNLVVNQHDDVYELRQQLKNTPIPQPKKNLTEGLLNEPPSIKNSDPLTPLGQNFVTFDQLNEHYQLFINRVQKQMATIGGGGETQLKYLDDVVGIATNPVEYDGKFLQYNHTLGKFIFGDGTSSNIANFVFVGSKIDLPPSVGGVINLVDNYTYFFTTTVDLQGDRLIAGDNTTILGGSSENCRIKSTGISPTTALLSSVYSLPIRNITLEAPWAINLVASNPSVHALDWFGVNFTNCAKVGIISSYNNFILLDGAFLNSQDLTFNGTTGTVGFNQCLFSGNFGLGGIKSILNFPSTFICTRRIRTTVCSFVVPSGYTGITVQDGATFSQPESFIIQTCNFSGPGTKIGVSTHTDVKSRDSFFEGNRGIDNTFPAGQFYMRDNSIVTSVGVGSTDVWTKIAGITTTDGATNSKFIETDNRLTYVVAIDRNFLSQATVTFTQDAPASGPFVDFDVEVGIFDYSTTSGIGTILKSSIVLIRNTTYGQYYTVNLTDIHDHKQNDYVELHIRNKGTDTGILVTDMNLLTTSI